MARDANAGTRVRLLTLGGEELDDFKDVVGGILLSKLRTDLNRYFHIAIPSLTAGTNVQKHPYQTVNGPVRPIDAGNRPSWCCSAQLHHFLNKGSDRLVYRLDWVVSQLGIAVSRLCLGMPEKLADHVEVLTRTGRKASEGMAKVMDTDIVEACEFSASRSARGRNSQLLQHVVARHFGIGFEIS